MRFAVQGTDEYAIKLSKLAEKSQTVAKKAIYKAAGIVTDAVRANLNGIATVDNSYNIIAYNTGKKARMSDVQKQGLLDGLGITGMQSDNGYWNIKIGFDGYNGVITQQYPQGQPNVLIARVFENGGSTAEATPFIKPAVSKTRKQALSAMQQVIDEETEKIMG